VIDQKRMQDTIDNLSLEIPRRLPPDLRQVFLTNYPDGKYGQLFEANYLACWNEFARRMEAGGFFQLHQRNAAVRAAPAGNTRLGRSESRFASFIDEIECKRQRQQQARRERIKRELDNNPIARLREAALKIAEACEQMLAEGRVH